ncbi:hypothetical protein LWI29_014794 [Acer saccharum]|uniref:Polygalacturonase n=1 Tax=Acer saccharum TaxID=4024 RepID=A0AA39VBA0_ACESA|nr:hypothetical protein LWI29_014794 [Acer saccharum]
MSLKSVTFMIFVAFLVWSSAFETCNARRGKHWRQSRSSWDSSLWKKKGSSSSHHRSSHKNHNGGSKPKPKPPSYHKPTPPASPPPYSKPKPNIPPPTAENGGHSEVFDVMDFGAKGNGIADDTKAFEAAWTAACKVESSIMIVPTDYVFLVGPISFSGPYCQRNIVFQLDGKIIAPTSYKDWGKGLLWWMDFTKLVGITIQGNGIIDGRGSVWWQDYPYDDPFDDESKLIVPLYNTTQKHKPIPVGSELDGKMPSIKPTALRFYGSFNVTVTGITIQNSPQCHLKFDNCIGVMVHDISVSSPGDSPNTDGIHLQNSKDAVIRSSTLACGDDCVSIQTGCSNIYGGSGSVQGVLFSNIQVSEVQLPIVIDQFYCDKMKCKNQTSAVALSGITYEKIRGTYTVKPVHFACSDNLPCVDVTLNSIQLKPMQERYHMYDPFCWQTFGELTTPTVPPIACLQVGKPSSNRPQSDHDAC